MKYYYFNSDAKSLGYSPHAQWIKYNLAFTAGDYEEFGVQALGKLNPWEILFMYVNGCGVVAAGSVSDSWAGSSSRGRDRLVYQDTEYAEYRIPVDWFLSIVNNPISRDDLHKIVGWTSAQGLQAITDNHIGARLLDEGKKRIAKG